MEREHEPQAGGSKLEPENLPGERLLLASSSPRRAEILRAVGWPFEVHPVEIDESPREAEEAVAYVMRLAREKAEAASNRFPGRLVLGADTVVVIDRTIVGKPRDMDDARRMLRQLSGRWHEVLTGVALLRHEGDGGNQSRVAHERTRVLFNEMSDAEIDWHVRHGKPLDKAGAYAVQGHAALFIREIQGDYWNVVGLPVQLVYSLAQQMRAKNERGAD